MEGSFFSVSMQGPRQSSLRSMYDAKAFANYSLRYTQEVITTHLELPSYYLPCQQLFLAWTGLVRCVGRGEKNSKQPNSSFSVFIMKSPAVPL